jgi:hypothetical protein
MEIPNFEKLIASESEGNPKCSSFAEGMHSNPYFYKYYFWVFHQNSPCDGREFLTSDYRLAFAEAQKLLKELEAAEKNCWLYNDKLPRQDPENTPWDPKSPRWQNTEWAPSFEEDLDPLHNGFK